MLEKIDPKSKRLIVCADGTWNKVEKAQSGKHLSSNVAKMAAAQPRTLIPPPIAVSDPFTFAFNHAYSQAQRVKRPRWQ